MTGTLIVGILAALVAFALMRFAAKQPWAVAIIAAVVVLVSINIEWIKPALENVGVALGTNTVLGIDIILNLSGNASLVSYILLKQQGKTISDQPLEKHA